MTNARTRPNTAMRQLLGASCLAAGLASAAAPAAGGESDAATIGMLLHQVQKCWNPPPGVHAVNPTARIRMVLARDGALAATPRIVAAPRHPTGRAFAESAVRAIRLCAPYRLPAATYEQWHDTVLTFAAKL